MCTEQDLKQIVTATVEEYADQLTDEVCLSVRGLVDYLRADNLAPIDFPDRFAERVQFILNKSARIDGARSVRNMILESIEDHIADDLLHVADAERTRQREEA